MSTDRKEQVVIYGLGKFAEYVAYVLAEDSDYDVVAFSVERNYLPDNLKEKDGVPVVCLDELVNVFPPSSYLMFIAVGDNQLRTRVFYETKSMGYSFISYVSSRALTWKDLVIGENVLITEDAVLQPFVSIGDNCILLAPRIGHHSTVGKNCLLSCCYLAGDVNVGNESFLGMNSTIKQGVRIAEKNIIGMGCSIAGDTEPEDVYTSANTTRKRNVTQDRIKGKYL